MGRLHVLHTVVAVLPIGTPRHPALGTLTKAQLFFVWAILGWGYYAYVISFCVNHVLHQLDQPTVTVVFLLIFHVLFGLAVVSYVQACFTNPGEIPEGFGEPLEEGSCVARSRSVTSLCCRDDTPLVRETKGSGQVRYCQKCQKKKPDRAHHCAQFG